MKLEAKAFGIFVGLIWGIYMVGATIIELFRGQGDLLSLFGDIYFGYTPSFIGIFTGFVWGFIDGFIGGYLVAGLYNLISNGS